MAYDEQLADRVRKIVAGMSGVTEKKMFGGLAFMINGNMACGPVNDILMVRVGPDAYEDSLAEPDADELSYTGRPMKGIVQVDIGSLIDDDRLAEWVQRGIDFAAGLPSK